MSKITNTQLAGAAVACIGYPYWFGTVLQKATDALHASKSRQYPAHYGAGRAARYKQDIANRRTVTDCSGLIKGLLRDNGVQAPDTNANGMYSRAAVKGRINTIPDTPGLAVWRDGHIGIYVGGGEVVEAQGFAYGVRRTKLAQRNFTHWMELPWVEYGAVEDAGNAALPFGDRTLRKGMRGADVRVLQEMLAALGYTGVGAADGVYGDKTEAAVREYQKANGLEIDGIVGKLTRAALLDDAPDEPEVDDPAPQTGKLVTTGNVHIRRGPGTQYQSLGAAVPGTTLDALTDGGKPVTALGWYAVLVDDGVAWVSGKYVKE